MTENTQMKERLCSVFSNANGEDPAGTAPSWERCMYLELAKPWDTYVDESKHFPTGVLDAMDRADERGVSTKLQCMTPDQEYSVEGHTRLIFYSRPTGPMAKYDKDEFLVPKDRVESLAEAYLNNPDQLGDFEDFKQNTANTRDIFVCSHGSHDTCCATFGYVVFEALRNQYSRGEGGALRVFQSSHIGGHRFSPNILDMPEGRNWVRLGVEDLDSLVHRNAPVSQLKENYRGWVALDTHFEQLVEREAFMQEGWSWAERAVSGSVSNVTDGDQKADVRLEFTDAGNGTTGAYEGTVEQTGSAPRVTCREGEKSEDSPQYTVSPLRSSP